MKGLIVIGYQGIGKSSCGGKGRCVDLESSNFYVDNKRSLDWYIPYCNIAMSIANQRYVVFVSSHKEVREQLRKMPLSENVGAITVFCPQKRWKSLWIERLEKRYKETYTSKDFKALQNAKEKYEENIHDLVNSGFFVYQPAGMDYDLMGYVKKMLRDWCLE